MIVGHGVRERSVVDLLRTAVDVVLRRYRCRRCTAVMTVGPAELSPRRRYTLGAIALALSLWSLLETAGHQVRARVSAQRRIGDGSLGRWERYTFNGGRIRTAKTTPPRQRPPGQRT